MDPKHNGEHPMKRQRGRGRKPGGGGGYHNNQGGGGHHPNRSIDSNGPETKVRGTASYINERYLQLARDAASSGDRVLSENYLQHADHYFRLWRSMQPAMPVQPPQQHFNEGADYNGDEERVAEEGADSEEMEARAEGDEQPEGEYAQQEERQREGGGDRDGEGGRRRRGRNRNRFRPDGERNYESREGEERGENREPREQREPRRERQPREERESAGPEGFSSGPKPAFLRSSE
jgi:hypothetical protein